MDNKITEEWRKIPKYEEYEVSNLGRVKSLYDQFKRPRVLIRKESVKPDGYCYLDLKRRQFYVHRLVAMAFIENPQNKPFVNHKDSNPSNNHVDNLEWVTPKENVHHSYLYGKRVKLKSVQKETTLTDFQVSQITTLRTIYTVNQISKLFNCKYTTLKNIIRKQKKSEILDNQQPSLYTSIYKDVEEGSTTKEHTPNLGDDIV